MARTRSAKDKALAPQLEDVAFTARGLALQFSWPNRIKNKKIMAQSNLSSSSYKTAVGDVECRNFTFTEEEEAPEPGVMQIQVVLVGLTIPTSQASSEETQQDKKDGLHTGVIGQHLPANGNDTLTLNSRFTGSKHVDQIEEAELNASEGFDKDDHDGVDALLVVTPCSKKQPAQTKLYVLVQPKDGLCRMYNCPGDEVYYFSEYRDYSKAAGGRASRWNKLVRAVAVHDDGQVVQPDLTAYATPRDQTVIATDPTLAFANKVHMLSSALSLKNSPWIMTELSKTLDDAVAPLMELVTNFPHTRLFLIPPQTDEVDSDVEMADEGQDGPDQVSLVWSAKEMLAEVAQQWPEAAQSLTPELLQRLFDGLDPTHHPLSAQDVEPFLRLAPRIEGCMGDCTDDHLVEQTLLFLSDARCNVPVQGAFSTTSINPASLPSLMTATINALVKLRSDNVAHQEALQSKLGNDVVPVSPAQLWQIFGNASDTDTARRAFDTFCKFMAYWNVGTADIINPQLTSIIDILQVAMGIKKSPQLAKNKVEDDKAAEKKEAEKKEAEKKEAEKKEAKKKAAADKAAEKKAADKTAEKKAADKAEKAAADKAEMEAADKAEKEAAEKKAAEKKAADKAEKKAQKKAQKEAEKNEDAEEAADEAADKPKKKVKKKAQKEAEKKARKEANRKETAETAAEEPADEAKKEPADKAVEEDVSMSDIDEAKLPVADQKKQWRGRGGRGGSKRGRGGEGAVTALVAIWGFFMLPNTPLTTSWLNPRERELAHARMERDRVGDSTEPVSMMEGLRQACRDKRTWLFCLMQNFHLSACSFNSFFPTVIKTLGFNTTITLLLTCPPFLLAGAAGIATGWSSGRMHERTWHITGGLLVAIVGFVIAASTMNTAGRYVACFIFPMGAYSVNSVIIGWASSTLSQTKEKKAVVLAMTNVGGQIGYIYGAYLWPDTDKPRYGIGFGASAGFALLSIACAWAIRVMLIKENQRLKASTNERVNLYGY